MSNDQSIKHSASTFDLEPKCAVYQLYINCKFTGSRESNEKHSSLSMSRHKGEFHVHLKSKSQDHISKNTVLRKEKKKILNTKQE